LPAGRISGPKFFLSQRAKFQSLDALDRYGAGAARLCRRPRNRRLSPALKPFFPLKAQGCGNRKTDNRPCEPPARPASRLFSPLPTALSLSPSAYCLLPSAYCLLPSAYCPPPTALCLLPSAYCPPPTACCFSVTSVSPVLAKTPLLYYNESRKMNYNRPLPEIIFHPGFPGSPTPAGGLLAVLKNNFFGNACHGRVTRPLRISLVPKLLLGNPILLRSSRFATLSFFIHHG
jgi:hypothetical protein